MTNTIVTPQTIIQTIEIDDQKIVIIREKIVQVVTICCCPSGLTGSFNIGIAGGYGGVFNITLLNGIVKKIGIYGM
jgi:hypothetical protein